MEELCLVLRLAAHVLADPGEGETPLMPLSMAHASTASASAGQVSLLPKLQACHTQSYPEARMASFPHCMPVTHILVLKPI